MLSTPDDPKPARAGFADLLPLEWIDTRVRFAGSGLVTPLGIDARSTWNELLAGLSICDHATASLPRQAGISRVSQLAIRAACEAVAQAGSTPGVLPRSHGAGDWYQQGPGRNVVKRLAVVYG